jgi:hypothetical protein
MVSSGMLRRVALVRTDVSCHADGGGARFLRNVGSYNSHTAYHPRRHHSSVCLFVTTVVVSKTV